MTLSIHLSFYPFIYLPPPICLSIHVCIYRFTHPSINVTFLYLPHVAPIGQSAVPLQPGTAVYHNVSHRSGKASEATSLGLSLHGSNHLMRNRSRYMKERPVTRCYVMNRTVTGRDGHAHIVILQSTLCPRAYVKFGNVWPTKGQL